MEYIFEESKNSLNVTIPTYRESEFDRKIILYGLEILKRGKDKFLLDKRYSEFNQLHAQLKKVFNDLPIFPSKTLFDISKNPEELEKRRSLLEKYLNDVIGRQEILSSEPLKKFLSLDNIAPEFSAIPPKLFAKTPDFTYGVRDFHYIQDKAILFVLISDMNIASRVDSYISNRKGEVKSSVGLLECYECEENDFKLNKLWSKSFASQAICLFWDPLSYQICVGLDDGTIYCGKVPKEMKFSTMMDIFERKIHESRIMGVGIDSSNNNLISVSKDKNLTLTNYTDGKINFTCPITYSELTNSYYDINSKRLITVDMSGLLLVYSLQKKAPEVKIRFETINKLGIRGLWFDDVSNLVFTGSIEDGEICVFNIESVEKQSYSKIIASMKSKTKIRVLCFSLSRKEIYSGHEDGTITIWSFNNQKPIYIIKNSESAITMLKVIEKNRCIIAASKEKSMKIWQMPKEWIDKNLSEEIENEEQIMKKQDRMLQYQKQNRDSQESDDDIKNWHQNL